MRELLSLSFLLLTLNVFGQAEHPAPPPHPVFVVPLQMGRDTLKNGKDTIRLSEITVSEMNETVADTNFTVMLTPRGDCGQLNLMKTTSRYFIVKQQTGTSMQPIFDYVVFAKQSRPWMPERPHPPGQ